MYQKEIGQKISANTNEACSNDPYFNAQFSCQSNEPNANKEHFGFSKLVADSTDVHGTEWNQIKDGKASIDGKNYEYYAKLAEEANASQNLTELVEVTEHKAKEMNQQWLQNFDEVLKDKTWGYYVVAYHYHIPSGAATFAATEVIGKDAANYINALSGNLHPALVIQLKISHNRTGFQPIISQNFPYEALFKGKAIGITMKDSGMPWKASFNTADLINHQIPN
ncbi:hypothetical protein HK100_003752 [Physocladia obscura]|uniref:Uncharacterized protein n=1 Tax=Physocladia obscura TaxID=109957 RepID=A0AAD5SZP9_9FUNG|nr:hypothetical protein HK100_003752 [Physocladia obscura]